MNHDGTPEVTPLAPFVARIEQRVLHDDGQESRLFFRIAGTRCDGTRLPTLELPAEEFLKMDWPVLRWGLHLEATRQVKEHLRAAILKHSGDTPLRTVYRHTGWKCIDGRPRFLHAGGALGADGTDTDIRVELPDRLAEYRLPEPPEGDELRAAVKAVLGLLDFADPTRPQAEAVAAVALALPFRAALGQTAASIWIEGLSGAFKTELAANVLQRFFGPGFSRVAALGSWFSTENALEAQAYQAKDVLFLIDDYRPPEGPDRSRYEARGSRMLRNAADRRGRDRARVDGSLQASKYPRGSLLVTAETGPPGRDQAAVARTLILRCAAERPHAGLRGTLDPEVLRRCAADARAGRYAGAMAGFLRWVASRYEAFEHGLRDRVDRLADEFRHELQAHGLHARAPETVADLFVGADEFLRFAEEIGAASAEEVRRLQAQVRDGLRRAAIDQHSHHVDSDPVDQFLGHLRSTLVAGIAHLAAVKGGPRSPSRRPAAGVRTNRRARGGRPLASSSAGSRRIGSTSTWRTPTRRPQPWARSPSTVGRTRGGSRTGDSCCRRRRPATPSNAPARGPSTASWSSPARRSSPRPPTRKPRPSRPPRLSRR